MKKILVIGAGRSAIVLIEYLVEHSKEEDWTVTVADANPEAAKKLIGDHEVINSDLDSSITASATAGCAEAGDLRYSEL